MADGDNNEFDVFKSSKWRGNRKSSFAQIFHARERESGAHGGKLPPKPGGPSDRAPVSKSKPQPEANFIKTCKNIKDVASELSEKEMEHFFMKVDVNSKGVVDFDDFTSYILQQQLAKEDEPGADFATYVKMKPSSKKGATKMEDESDSEESDEEDEVIAERPVMKSFKACNTTVERPSHIIEKVGMYHSFTLLTADIVQIILLSHIQTYVTATQDGMLKLWHGDSLKLLRTQKNGGGAWITDIVAMAQQPLAVFAMDRSVTFYDTGRLSFDVLGRIENLRNGALCATWVRTPENDKLLYGDDRGYLHVYDFSDEWGGEIPRIAAGVTEELLPGMSEKLPWKIHNNWVTRIKYLSHSSSLLSCSMDSTLLMLDLEKQKRKWSGKEHHHGIFALDYCRSFNFIVTCGLERNVNIWNPFTAKIMGQLIGHQSPVVDVVVNEDDNQIVSVATDSIIKIWDMRSNRCMQTVVDKTLDKSGEPPIISRLLYDKRRSVLLGGGTSLQAWRKRLASETRSGKICGSGFSSTFRQLIVAEIESLVTIWNIDDGHHTFSFSDGKSTKMSAMTVDASGRRLLIGGQDGTLRMWNFNNGQCLKEYCGFGQDEITCVVCLAEGRSKYVAAGGWNGRVCIWHDGLKESEPLEREMHGHTDDIVCMSICPPGGVATGGYDGKVIVWKLDGMIKCVLNPPPNESFAKSRSIVNIQFLGQLEKVLAVFVSDGYIYFWRVPDASVLHEIPTCHIGAPGPMCSDSKNELLFSSDIKGYVKSWSLAACDFHQAERPLTPVPEMFCFRAHHETIVSMTFIETDRILVTASTFGTRQEFILNLFRELIRMDLEQPSVDRERSPDWTIWTWIGRKAYYVSQDSDSSASSRLSSSAGSRSSSSRESRGSSLLTTSGETESKETTPTDFPEAKEPSSSAIQAKAAAILDAGPPHLRLDSWFAPLQAAFHRQLPIKGRIHTENCPLGTIVAAKSSARQAKISGRNDDYGKKHEHRKTEKIKIPFGEKTFFELHHKLSVYLLQDPLRLSLPNIHFNMPKDKLMSIMRRSTRTTPRSSETTRSIMKMSMKKYHA
ncbi:hypothetical protein SELMODRAFT_416582 [Selaginella moellendorffii]|uniref:EF-hand domain-containing protein n=1 Tax=Selaginella moellendorffii TaxID=88036 RepID=D8RZR9_SELML|nr:hypothetical protein SELMODRAFT_416582 [Selaginella moellendorffii]